MSAPAPANTVILPRPASDTADAYHASIKSILDMIRETAEQDEDLRNENMELARHMEILSWTGCDEKKRKYDSNQVKCVQLQQQITVLENALPQLNKRYHELLAAEASQDGSTVQASTSTGGAASTNSTTD